MDSHEQHKQWRNKLSVDFFSWYWREAQKREEERLKMPWFYFTSCRLSPAVLLMNKLPGNEEKLLGVDVTYGWHFEQGDMLSICNNHHLKIFLN